MTKEEAIFEFKCALELAKKDDLKYAFLEYQLFILLLPPNTTCVSIPKKPTFEEL